MKNKTTPNLLATPASDAFNSALGPYIIPAFLWIIAWCLQAFVSQFVTSPLGLDVIYFTLGARLFSILVFRLQGVIGLLSGSLFTNCFIGSPQYPDPTWFLLSYAAANTLLVYLIVVVTEKMSFDSVTLSRLSFKSLLAMMSACALTVSTVHEVFFRFLKPHPVTYDFHASGFLIQMGSRVVGGMLFVLLIMLVARLLLSKADHQNLDNLSE